MKEKETATQIFSCSCNIFNKHSGRKCKQVNISASKLMRKKKLNKQIKQSLGKNTIRLCEEQRLR